MNPIELNLFASRLESICDQMGEMLRNAAFSPNIRDRLDFSCAIFDANGELSAQAAHIPVHLGSMAFAMSSIIRQVEWAEGDQVILNDPFLGGTHLPDVTMVAPVFINDRLQAFVVNRAHHADIGSETPGSMPVSSHIEQEGLVISPTHLYLKGKRDDAVFNRILEKIGNQDVLGDFSAQAAANIFGVRLLKGLIELTQPEQFRNGLLFLNDYAEKLALSSLKDIPDGVYSFEDYMDDDGQKNRDILIRLKLTVDHGRVQADFNGTADQVEGNINCPLSVAAAGVFYVFRCLMPEQTPACAGAFRSIEIRAPEGCLLNAKYPAAVAAGNVETSTRVVDVTLGALGRAIPERIPAASHGSMNNVSMGGYFNHHPWHYYETIGGGMGAGKNGGGLSALQTHMTNTLNTPIEVLESLYPLRVKKYAVRRNSGGIGARNGGDGTVRSYEFLSEAQLSVLTERRHFAPWGSGGGEDGKPGENLLNGNIMPAKFQCVVQAGDLLEIRTPGGGGYLSK